MFRSRITIPSCRRDMIDIYKNAVEAVRPEHLIERALRIEDDYLVIDNVAKERTRVDIRNTKLHVIGGGKSVFGMACGIAKLAQTHRLNESFSRGLLSIPIGLRKKTSEDECSNSYLRLIDVKCMYGSQNNLPDDDSIRASSSLLENIKDACDEDKREGLTPLFIVLISGGGSACLTQPKHVDLQAKLELIRILVQRGASIIELNAVRRYLSSIKGGQLARYILSCHEEAKIVSLIISDVIDDPVEFIASGPTHLIPRRVIHENFVSVLEKYEIATKGYLSNLEDDLEDHPPYENKAVANIIVGNNHIALEAAKKHAHDLGYVTGDLGACLEGKSDTISQLLRVSGESLLSKGGDGVLVIGAGEATVTKLPGESWGLGGRVQEMALDYMLSVISNPPDGKSIDMFLAGTTDGQDGPTDVAACLASYSEWSSSKSHQNFDLNMAKAAKQNHDSFTFWTRHQPDWLIKTGMTGTNVMDLYMYSLVRDPSLSKL